MANMTICFVPIWTGHFLIRTMKYQRKCRAIKHFIREGGILQWLRAIFPLPLYRFTDFAPNAPIVTHNGAAVYDVESGEYLFNISLDDGAADVLEYIEKQFDFVGFEVYDKSKLYAYRPNESINWHVGIENLKVEIKNYKDVPCPWTNSMFVQQKYKTDKVRSSLLKSRYRDKYSFIQSSGIFLEVLSKEASKGNALIKMREHLNRKIHTVICAGDNENDISLLRAADVSYAVGNAIEDLKKEADNITVTNNEHAIAKIIRDIT